MLAQKKPKYQSVGDKISESESDDKIQHEMKDLDRQNAGIQPQQPSSYQQDKGDPTIYALMEERPQIYSNAIDDNSLVATKTTVTPIMHFNPYFEVVSIFVVVGIGWIALLMYYIPNPPVDPYQFSFPVALGLTIFLGIDIFLQLKITWIHPRFPIQRYLVNCLLHHVASILACCVPLVTGEHRMFQWMFALLSVEVNTAFLKWRRILNRGSLEFRYVNYCFYITWFGIRVIGFPIFTVYVWWIFFSQERDEPWVLVGCICITILTGLYGIWTYNLMDKKTRKTKFAQRLAEVAIA